MVAINARVNIDPALRRVAGLRRFPKLYAENVRRFGDQAAAREAQRLRMTAQVDTGAQRATIGWRRKDQRRHFGLGATVAIGWRLGFGVAGPLPLNKAGKPYYRFTKAPVQQGLAGLRFRRVMVQATDAARIKALSELRRGTG